MIDHDRPAVERETQIASTSDVGVGPQSRNSLTPEADPVAKVAGWLAHLIDPDQTVELRALGMLDVPPHVLPDGTEQPQTYAGTFRGTELADLAAESLALSGRCRGVYYTLNPVRDRQRQAPRVQRASRGQLASDADVLRRTRLLIDVDAVRPSADVPASDAEHEAALAHARYVRAYLTARGWPAPVMVDTGNGAQLVYRIEAPNTAEVTDLVRRVLQGLATPDAPGGRVDTTVHNVARIARVPGTRNLKGTPSADRPHRRCVLLDAPNTLAVVSAELLGALADEIAPRPVPRAVAPSLPSRDTTGRRGRETDPVERARRYLARMPGAVSGEGGHTVTLKAAIHLVRGFRLDPDAAYPLLAEWNQTCSPPWSENDLRRKLDQAEQSRAPAGYIIDRDDEPSYAPLDASAVERLLAATEPEPLPPPEPCAFAARDDIRELLTVCPCEFPFWKNVRRKSTGINATAGFRCNSAERCAPCRTKNRRDLFDNTADWLIDVTTDPEPAVRMKLYGAVVPTVSKAALVDAVSYRGGRSLWIRTADTEGVQAALDSPTDGFPTLRQEEENEDSLKVGNSEKCLYLSLLPQNAEPLDGFAPVPVAGALWAMYHALQSPAPRPEDAKRQRLWGKSHTWGATKEKRASDIELRSRSAFSSRVVRGMAAELGIAREFTTGDDRIQGRPAGWKCVSEAHDEVFERLLSGAGSKHPPTKERVVELARDWFEVIPTDLAFEGSVREALRRILDRDLWFTPLLRSEEVVNQLRDSQRKDMEIAAEVASVHRGLIERYRGREQEITSLIRMLIA